MSSSEQDEFFKRRAAQERVAAKLADDQRAARSHLEMAKRYGAMSAGGDTTSATLQESATALSADFRIIP